MIGSSRRSVTRRGRLTTCLRLSVCSSATTRNPDDHRDFLQQRDDEASVDVAVRHRPIDEAAHRHATYEHVLVDPGFVDDHVAIARLLRDAHLADRHATPIDSQPFGDDRHDATWRPTRTLIVHPGTSYTSRRG
jgi:hypothetical protein